MATRKTRAWMMAACPGIVSITISEPSLRRRVAMVLTLGRWVLSKVLGLVTTENSSSLDLGGRSLGKLLVEVDDALHRDGVGVGTDRLCIKLESASEFRCRYIKCGHGKSPPIAHTSPKHSYGKQAVTGCRASSACVEPVANLRGFQPFASQSLQISRES